MAEANFSSFKEQFDDQLTCGVCLDQYTNPKALPCQHSFCLKCIQPLPKINKDGKHYINCPACRVDHLVPQGGVMNLPKDFKANSLLDLRKKLNEVAESAAPTDPTCPKHNDPLKVYCETCCQVICRDCTIDQKHKTHNFHLISEYYPKYQKQIQDSLDLVKHKMAGFITAIMHLSTREMEVLEQGMKIKEQINTHTKQSSGRVKNLCTQLSQQVDTIVQQKTENLQEQRREAETIYDRLEACQKMIQRSLKECSKQKLLTEKHTMMEKINTATRDADPTMFQPIEQADIKFLKRNNLSPGIGYIHSTVYDKATLTRTIHFVKRQSIATLTVHSHDGSPFFLPPSLISSTLTSSNERHTVKCDVTQINEGKYNITFTPPTRGNHRLNVQIGGIDGTITLVVKPTTKSRGMPIKIITGLSSPRGIAVYDNGEIAVAEGSTSRIAILDKEGKRLRSLGYTTSSKVSPPTSVAITRDGGHILVTDHSQLYKLKTDQVRVTPKRAGDATDERIKKGGDKQDFRAHRGVTVHPDKEEIFIADSKNNCIQVFNTDLTFSHNITLKGEKKFSCPCQVAVDREGYLYVAEYDNHCITKLTPKGKFVTRFGCMGSAPSQLFYPCSVVIDDNLVYVCEWGNNRVSIFNCGGEFICYFGNQGRGAREGDLYQPNSITIDGLGDLYVSDGGNNRISVF